MFENIKEVFVMKKFSFVIRIIAVVLCLCITVSAAYFGDINNDGAITAADARTILRAAARIDVLDAEQKRLADANGDGHVNASDARTALRMSAKLDPLREVPAVEASKEEILAKYTEVMNGLKTGVASYDKKEYQRIADDYDFGTVGNLILPIVRNIMTSEEEAQIQNLTDREQLPVVNNIKGCLLTDANKIKAAKMYEDDTTIKIDIVLHDEVNPLPAAANATSCNSAVGSMFTPASQKEIDDIVAEFSGVIAINQIKITAKDCTSTVVFDKYTGEIETLEQTMNYFIEVDASAVIVPMSGYATVVNKLEINNIAYKGNYTTATSKEDILNIYTEVMNGLKAGVASYDKKEYQRISDDYDFGTVGNLILPVAYGIMISEDEAEIQHRDDMEQIPVLNNKKGCLLTDTSKIKAAHMTERNGKTTIVIVLHDEVSPLPAADGASSCDSAVGSMFNPLSRKEIDDIVAEFSGVVTINKLQITAKDCTATLVFDSVTGEVEMLEHKMHFYIEVDAKTVVVPVTCYATITNSMTINNIEYR